jgi:nitroreductase
MDTNTTADATTVRAALAEAARMAGLAPSIHNTQPWQWRVIGSELDLRIRSDRRLEVTDPSARMLTISCGAALGHALIALAAEGWQAEVRRTPDPADRALLATITLVDRIPVTPAAMRNVQLLRVRHTDRRTLADAEPPVEGLQAIANAVESAGAHLHLLRPDDVIELASAAARAQTIEIEDPRWRDELAYWTGGERASGLGIPDAAIPAEPAESTVPGRDFGHAGGLPVGAGHDGAARYAIIYSAIDATDGWLRGGEALTAGWIAAVDHGLSVVPLSAAVEVTGTRLVLRHLLANLGEPLLVLRIGTADPDEPGPAHTPRLPSDQTVEIVP